MGLPDANLRVVLVGNEILHRQGVVYEVQEESVQTTLPEATEGVKEFALFGKDLHPVSVPHQEP